MDVIISRTGVGHGWGSNGWKWVSGLTLKGRDAVRSGSAIVLIPKQLLYR